MTTRKELKKQRRLDREARQRARERAQTRHRLIRYGLIAATVIGAMVVAASLGAVVRLGGGEDANPPGDPNLPTLSLTMGDNFFQPDTLVITAGQAYRIKIMNRGRDIHNMFIAGPDNTYDTADDINSAAIIKPGKTDWVLVTMQETGVYKFRCTFHAEQVGHLVVE